MAHPAREQLHRERTRTYQAALDAARAPVEVMVLLAKGRESRPDAHALEEMFAATSPRPGDERQPLPAAVWVALRQGDVDATIDALVACSSEQFLIAAHEQLDDTYRLTTVEERRGLPDVTLLQDQVAAFLQLPPDVVAIAAGWGPDDPRTEAEIHTLLDQRFGPPSFAAPPQAATAQAATAQAATAQAATAHGHGRELRMSSTEFAALLNLTPEQGGVLDTLVRQADLVITA
jgi:hypothetical protein